VKNGAKIGARLCFAQRNQPQQLRQHEAVGETWSVPIVRTCCGWSKTTQPRSFGAAWPRYFAYENVIYTKRYGY